MEESSREIREGRISNPRKVDFMGSNTCLATKFPFQHVKIIYFLIKSFNIYKLQSTYESLR